MRSCEHCDTPVHDTWEYCLRCGAELPAPPPREPRRLAVPALGGAVGWARRVRIPAPSVGIAAPSGGGGDRLAPARSAFGSARRAMVPAWSFVAAIAVLSVIVVALALTRPSDDAAVAEVQAAQLAQTQAQGEAQRLANELTTAEAAQADLQQQLEVAQTRITELEGQIEEQIAEGQSTVETLEAEVARLESQIEELSAARAQQDAVVTEQTQQIEALFECLGGLQVALAFSSEGRDDLADRALEAADTACTAVQTFQ